MTLHRLTLLPPAEAKKAGAKTRPGRFMPMPADYRVDVLSIARMARGGRWRTEAMRSYDRPVLYWFTRGQGRLSVSGRTSGYSAHSAVYLPAGTMHGFAVTPAVLGSMVRLTGDDSALWPLEPTHLRIHEVHLQRELTGIIDDIEREASGQQPHSETAVQHHAGLLAIWFARTAAAKAAIAAAAPAETAAQRLTEAYTALIEREYRKPVGVQHFAARLGVTPTHLTRSCRAAAGRAALDILTDRRHFEACRLLKDTTLPVRRIAEQTGFASPAYFTRAFRARTGASPTEFRDAR